MSTFTRYKFYLSAGLGACFGAATVYSYNNITKQPIVESVSIENVIDCKWDADWDRREPTSLAKPKPGSSEAEQNEYNSKLKKLRSKGTRHIFLIRHGQYNMEGKTDKERVLTDLGEKQASATGERLKLLAFPYTKIIRSTMTRATQTSKLIEKYLPGVPVSDCSMLEEGAPIPPEPRYSGRWKPELYYYEDGARIEAAFRKYIHRAPPEQKEDSFEIFVCHGNVIRYFICRAMQFPPSAWLRFSINHASISVISINPTGRVTLRHYSDTGHMPVEMMTTS